MIVTKTLDSETTGVDLFHACRPFLVSICSSESPDDSKYWPWRVDPLTRKVLVDRNDLLEIVKELEECDELVFQNAKFDVSALISAGLKWKKSWWKKVHDTLYSGHLLASGERHNLTDQVLSFLSVDIEPFEIRLGEVVNECRRLARREFPTWAIAKEGMPGLPSLGAVNKKREEGEKTWKWDMWLPFEIAEAKGLPDDHEYRTCTRDYNLADTSSTLHLWLKHKELLEERGLWEMYNKRRELIRIITEMEANGVTYSNSRLATMVGDFTEQHDQADATCTNIAASKGHELKLPKSGTNKSILAFAEAKDGLDMPTVLEQVFNPSMSYQGEGQRTTNARTVNKKGYRTPTGQLSLKGPIRTAYRSEEEKKNPKSWKVSFVKNWDIKQAKATALGYMAAYKRYGVPLFKDEEYVLLHPALNATGSGTLRFSSERPNEQNVSKRNEENIRYCFGPKKGREWWCEDFENLELRLPAYEAGEEEMIALFEKPEEGPYYGSQHLLIAHVLYPQEFEDCLRRGVSFNDPSDKGGYKSTLYQWVKNGNFAVTYGAVEESGTADAAYHVTGAQRLIKKRFKKLAKLNETMVAIARKQGFVTTMVDKELGIGYPLQIPRSHRGDIIPTTPLNYHVQGTAMWCTCKSMMRCAGFLEKINSCDPETLRRFQVTIEMALKRYFMTMQVHDEIVFDFPKGPKPTSNLLVARECQRLMELAGDDVGVPLRVDVSYHPNNWAKSVDLEEVVAA